VGVFVRVSDPELLATGGMVAVMYRHFVSAA
jgi:hypothetical protein